MFNRFTILNFVFFQALWFASVVAAGVYQLHWLAMLALVPMTVAAWLGPARRADFTLAAVAVIVGLLLDNLWVELRILDFAHASNAPYWIGFLWYGMALSVNHSLAWFRDQRWLGPLVVGIFAPVTYLAGERFGAVAVLNLELTVVVALAWMVLFVGLTQLSFRLLPANSLKPAV